MKTKKNVNLINCRMDNVACGYYRAIFPDMALYDSKQLYYTSTNYLGMMPNIQQNIKANTVIKCNRFYSEQHEKYFMSGLHPLKLQTNCKVVYDIDDILIAEDMPIYNPSKKNHKDTKMKLYNMMNISDYVTVSTVELGLYYHKKLGIALNKFRVVPNFIPTWWGKFDTIQKTVPTKPRIGFPCSFSHFNMLDDDSTLDDFSHISDFIRSTTKKYEWVFFGHVPKHLWDLLEKKEISVINGSNFLSYLHMLRNSNLDCVVAPLNDNIFNKCKSNIKLLEAACTGIPFIGQDICTYNKYTKSVFKDGNSLQNQLDRIFKTNNTLNTEINLNFNFMQSNKSEDKNLGWWLENNLHYYEQYLNTLI